jgi:hypothetical protein
MAILWARESDRPGNIPGAFVANTTISIALFIDETFP